MSPRNLAGLPSHAVVAWALAVVAWAIAAGSAPMTLGCSSSGSPASAGPSDASTGGMQGVVSFSRDVMPHFQGGCTISAVCHGQPNNTQEANLYLGFNVNDTSGTNTPQVISMICDELKGMALEDPQMPLIDPGNPDNSYLLRKLNGTQNDAPSAAVCMMPSNACSSYSSNCTAAQPCGATMPAGSAPWTDPAMGGDMAGLTLLTNWVMQGAPNN